MLLFRVQVRRAVLDLRMMLTRSLAPSVCRPRMRFSLPRPARLSLLVPTRAPRRQQVPIRGSGFGWRGRGVRAPETPAVRAALYMDWTAAAAGGGGRIGSPLSLAR